MKEQSIVFLQIEYLMDCKAFWNSKNNKYEKYITVVEIHWHLHSR